jgi:hypothetical protein
MTVNEEATPTPEDPAERDLDELDDAGELDDIEFVLEEVEAKIAPLALAAA